MKTKLTSTILLVIAVLFSACSNENQKMEHKKRFVKVVQPKASTNNETNLFNGQLSEKRDVKVAFKVGGQVMELLVDEGDFVKKGDVIAQIDKRDYIIQLQSAEAQFKQIEGEYKRYKELYAQKKLPANTLEKLEAGYLSAESGYERANNALNDTELRAPFSGYVYKREVQKFENVGPGQAIISLLDVSQLEVHFSLSERQLDIVNTYKSISCDVPNVGLENIPAQLISVNEKANGNDMFDVRLQIDNMNINSIKPGMSVKVKVELPKGNENNATVPLEAIFNKDGKTYVWIYNQSNSVVQKREINIDSFSNEGQMLVSKGLNGDEWIVSAGVNSLQDNQEVRILEKNNL